jgi:hypothetical protein
MQKTDTIIVRFKLREVFPLDDNISVPFLRLMAATNDVRHLQKLVLSLFDKEPTNETEVLVREGELTYFLRMFFGHLYEAGSALRNLDTTSKKRVDTLIANDKEAVDLICRLRAIYNDTSEHSLCKALEGVRNLGAFHYPHESFTSSLQEEPDKTKLTLPEEVKLALVNVSGMRRYAVTDVILKKIAIGAAGGGIEDFDEKVSKAISLAGLLTQTVDHLLTALFSKHENAIVENKTEIMQVPNFRTVHQSD